MVCKIKDLYSKPFNCKIVDIPYFNFIDEILSQKPLEETEYFKYIYSQLKRYGTVFEKIKDKQGVINRTQQFRDLAYSIKKEYKPVVETCYKNGLPYGGITTIKKSDKIFVVDGHHRLAVLNYLGYDEVEVYVSENNSNNYGNDI